MKRPKLITISGPTAVGKTSFAIALAQQLGCSILSGDARQFYKEMQLGTAVPTEEELRAVPHYFIQHKSVSERYTVGDFEKDALAVLRAEFKRKEVAILVGGSNLYTQAVVQGLDAFPSVPKDVIQNWQQKFDIHGIVLLQEELKRLDPDYYAVVDLQNHVRLLRALSVCTSSGKAYSSFLGQTKKERPFEEISIELTMPRDDLYKRIHARVDAMIALGLVDEVRGLLPYKNLNALQTVGYQELFLFLEGTQSLEESIEAIKKNTRRFAKRQLTWLRNHPCLHQLSFDTVVNNDLLSKLGLEKEI